MELLKAIGLVSDEKGERGENAEPAQETDEVRRGSSGSVPTKQRAATTTTTPTIMADGGPPLVDLGSDTSAARRRRSTSTAEVLNKLEEVVFFWSASHKTSGKPDEAVAADPHANTSADSFESPTHSGWLTKQGAIHKTWRKRYFVLNRHLLYYFDGSSARRPKGVIDLTGCEVMRDMTRGKKHCFQVSHKKNMQQRIFLLHAKEDDDMKQWMRVINAAIDSTRPSGEAAPSSPSSSPLRAKASPRQVGSSSSSPTPSDDEEGQEAARDTDKGKEATSDDEAAVAVLVDV